MANINDIQLGGVTLRTRSQVVGKNVSEFNAGLKVGPATYDERTHAFWLALEDFSGGVGYRHIDIREELGLVWDNQGLDITRRGHLTLPPLQTSTAITAPSGFNYGVGKFPSHPMEMFSGKLYVGYGGAIYESADYGTTLTKILDIPSMTEIMALCNYKGYLYAFGLGTNAYRAAAPGTAGSWATTSKPIVDGIVFDDKLVGMWDDGAGTDGIVFSTDGATWNTEVAGDGEYIFDPPTGPVQFVGAGMAPWREPCVYFLGVSTTSGALALYALDFFARKATEIDVTGGMCVMDACIWQNDIAVSDGYNVWLYNMDSQQIREIGLPRRSGVAPCFEYCQFLRLFGIGDYLYSLVNHYPPPYSQADGQIWRYNGAGWSPYGKQITSFTCYVVGCVSPYVAVYRSASRRILMVAAPTLGSATGSKRVYMDLPTASDTPEYGVDSFEDGDLYTITPWYDMGFHDLDGALFWVKTHSYHLSATEDVKIEYQLDYDEAGAWTQMVDSAGSNDTFTATTDTLYFKPASGDVKAGVEFRSVRFRITLDRGSTATHTPEVVSFTICYDKKPDIRTVWAIRLDVNGMLERASTYQIDAVDFTVEGLWNKLKELWDTKTLTTLSVPNISEDMLVRIADMKVTADEFRTAVKGKGFIDIQALETVGG